MKAHGHNRISIRILKICGPSICKPLEFIFKSCLEFDIIPLEWKKGHIFLAHPNKKKTTVSNKLPADVTFSVIYQDVCSTNQSGFKLTDSCIKQLLSITHGTYDKLDKGFKVRDVFLDIFKLKHNGISSILLRLIKDCVSGRKQRVTFNGQCSLWMDIQQDFLRTLCLDLFFFLIYINDLSGNCLLTTHHYFLR